MSLDDGNIEGMNPEELERDWNALSPEERDEYFRRPRTLEIAKRELQQSIRDAHWAEQRITKVREAVIGSRGGRQMITEINDKAREATQDREPGSGWSKDFIQSLDETQRAFIVTCALATMNSWYHESYQDHCQKVVDLHKAQS